MLHLKIVADLLVVAHGYRSEVEVERDLHTADCHFLNLHWVKVVAKALVIFFLHYCISPFGLAEVRHTPVKDSSLLLGNGIFVLVVVK